MLRKGAAINPTRQYTAPSVTYSYSLNKLQLATRRLSGPIALRRRITPVLPWYYYNLQVYNE